MIDFHCHIVTPNSRTPEADGKYYQTVAPLAQGGEWVGLIWQETIETLSEAWRSPTALKQYAQMSPIIYSEMSRRMTQMTAKRLTLEMAENTVRQAVAVAMDPYVPTREVVAACTETKGILLPFGSVDPWAEDWAEQLDETMSLPVRGFKFHDQLQRIAYGEPRFQEIIARIAASRPNLPVYLHTGTFPIYKPMETDWPFGLNRLLTEFPEMRFVCGHSGWNRPSAALRAARRHGNLFLETSWQPPRVLRRLCDALGPERLLLGSDSPLFSMRRAIRNCRAALTPSEFRLVSEENAHRLLEDRPHDYSHIVT